MIELEPCSNGVLPLESSGICFRLDQFLGVLFPNAIALPQPPTSPSLTGENMINLTDFFTVDLTVQTLLGVLIIFALRVANVSLDTLRMLFVMRGRKGLVWILGVITSVVYVVVIASVLQQTNNILSVLGYAMGYATGNVVGMWLEERMAMGFAEVRIISPQRGAAIRESLRDAEYAVTEIPARGKDGTVTILNCSVRRKEIAEVEKITRAIDADAFITSEDLRAVQSGFWGLSK